MDQNEIICFCFGFTRGQIVADALSKNGPSIVQRISDAKKQGLCRCSETNPSGK